MPIESFVGRDGTARIVINGRETKFRAPSLDEARDKVRDMAIAHAVETRTAQHFIAYDPDANWQFYIAPDGTMTVLPTPVIAPRPLSAPTVEPEPAPPAPQAQQQPEPQARPQLPAEYYAPQAEVIDHTVVVPRKAARPTLIVHVEGGEALRAQPPIVLGRRPAEIEGHTSITLVSPGRECSRTHAVVDVDDACRLIVTDQDAANGTTADATPLAPHTPTVVPNGVRLQLGDVAVRIEAFPPGQSPVSSAPRAVIAPHKEEAS